jgi:hypothetical protein
VNDKLETVPPTDFLDIQHRQIRNISPEIAVGNSAKIESDFKY